MGVLHIVDLAGNEDNRQTGNTGQRLAESNAINQYDSEPPRLQLVEPACWC